MNKSSHALTLSHRWIFWPSFNGALASNPGNPDSPAQFYCVMNTVVALLGAACAAFATSAGVLGKFDMVTPSPL